MNRIQNLSTTYTEVHNFSTSGGFIFEIIKDDDFFEGFYEDCFIKILVGITHLIGTIDVILLIFFLWFERSGQAGHFRTLVNQLVSFNVDQV